jgi:hypothetical protein
LTVVEDTCRQLKPFIPETQLTGICDRRVGVNRHCARWRTPMLNPPPAEAKRKAHPGSYRSRIIPCFAAQSTAGHNRFFYIHGNELNLYLLQSIVLALHAGLAVHFSKHGRARFTQR